MFSFQESGPTLQLMSWSNTISSSATGTYDHRQSTLGMVGLLAYAMLANKSTVSDGERKIMRERE